jgi:hypothetical protein
MSVRKHSNTKIKVGCSSKSIPIRDNGDNYYYVTNFEQTTEKECKDFDKTNRNIYEKYLSIYKKIEKQIENCPFRIDKKPMPPEAPTNLERLINWRQNNIEKNVRLQTISILFLLNRNMNISLDYSNNGILPCDTIDVASRESGNNLELMIKESEHFLELQKKSLFIKNTRKESSTDDEVLDYGFQNPNKKQPIQINNIYPNINNSKEPSAPPYFN